MNIVDTLGRTWNGECMGCGIASGELIPPGGVIKETANFILLQDPEIPIKGFLIINSKRHVVSIAQMSREEALELAELCYDARKALLSVTDIAACTWIQEEQSDHFHLWILPRYPWMGEKFDGSLSSVRPMMQYARENLKVKSNINDIIDLVGKLRTILNI